MRGRMTNLLSRVTMTLILGLLMIMPAAARNVAPGGSLDRGSINADDGTRNEKGKPPVAQSKMIQSNEYTYLGTDAFAGLVVDNTYYDIASNGTIGRKIARGSDGRVHFTWMYKPSSTVGTSDRDVRYRTWTAAGEFGSIFEVSNLTGGFSTLSLSGTKAVVSWHEGSTTTAAVDFASGTGTFTNVTAPSPNCQGIVTANGPEGEYIWPQITYDNAGNVVHLLATEATPGDDIRSLVYYRGTGPSVPSQRYLA